MLELLLIVGFLAVLFAGLIAAAKFLFALVLLPFKLIWWGILGLVGLFIVVPVVVFAICTFSFALPFILMMFAAPVILFALAIALLVKLFT